MKLLTVILVLTLLVAPTANCWAQWAADGGDAATVAAVEQSIVDAIARAEPSVVAISRTTKVAPSVLQVEVEDIFGGLREPSIRVDQSQTTGAGVIIDPAGLVLTQYLAVRDGDEHSVTTIHGRTYPATVKAADPRSGLAVLAIAREGEAPADSDARTGSAGAPPSQRAFPSLSLGDAASLRKGQFVIVVGDPYAIRSDGEPTASWGTVTNLARKASAGTNLNDTPGPAGDYRTTYHHLGTLIQVDARLGWSAGGGAVVNLRGELVGITTTAATIAGHERPAGYAIPIDDTARRVIDTLKQGREVEYGLLGVSFRSTGLQRDAAQADGTTIGQVYPGSPAEQAGLQINDRITRVADKPVTSIDSVQLAVGTLPPGAPVAVDYLRDNQPGTVAAKLAKLNVPGKKIITDRAPAWRGMRVDFAMALDAPSLSEKLASGAIDPDGCVAVVGVEPDSAAGRAGVQAGAFIHQVNGVIVRTPDEFRKAVADQTGVVTLRFTQPIRTVNQSEQFELEIP